MVGGTASQQVRATFRKLPGQAVSFPHGHAKQVAGAALPRARTIHSGKQGRVAASCEAAMQALPCLFTDVHRIACQRFWAQHRLQLDESVALVGLNLQEQGCSVGREMQHGAGRALAF